MPLSTGTYGKASPMDSTGLADRITAVLENAHAALDTLDQSNRTGAVADQGAVNTLRKVVEDMGTIAVDARKAAADDAAQDASNSPPAAAGQKDASTPKTGSGTSSTASGTTSKP